MNNEYRKWTDEEVALLEDRATSSTVKELAEELGRPVKMVRWKIKKLGLTPVDARTYARGAPRTAWTEDRLSYLREHATEPSLAIAEVLGMSVRQVRDARTRYGILGRGQARKHTPEEVERRIAPLRGVQKVDRSQPRACTQCGEVRPIFQYPSEDSLQSGLCEECRKEQRAIRWQKVPDAARAVQYKVQKLRQYSLTEEHLDQMLGEQNGCCALCFVEFSDKPATRMGIDHDHRCCSGIKSCGKCVRGLLCHRCNVMIGFLEGFVQRGGDPQRIVDYLS